MARNERLFWYSLLASFLVILLLGFSNPGLFAQSPEPSNYLIKIRPLGFIPTFAVVNSGSTVTWRNDDSEAHFLSAEGAFGNQELPPGMNWTYKFNKPGVYECRTLHAVGIVVVD